MDATQPEPALMLTVTEVAALSRISRSKLYELIASGDLRSIKIGRRRLVSRASLHEFLAVLEAACAVCADRPADHIDGLCTPCHTERLAASHRAALDAHAARA